MALRDEHVIFEHQQQNARAQANGAIAEAHDLLVAPAHGGENLHHRIESWNVLEEVHRYLRNCLCKGLFFGSECLAVIEFVDQGSRQGQIADVGQHRRRFELPVVPAAH